MKNKQFPYPYRTEKCRPTLVIDLMNLVVLFSRNKIDYLCGSRNNIVSEQVDLLFKSLSSVAELVFFEDGPVEDDKLELKTSRQNDRYQGMVNILEHIYEGTPIRQIYENDKELPRVSAVVDFLHDKAKTFGQLIVTTTNNCDIELARYASDHSNVLAILANDSDFLIFSGEWRYFSLRELNIDSLKTMEYNRKTLCDHLQLTYEELSILSTLAGNDCIPYEKVRAFHYKFGHEADKKFPGIADYIKTKLQLDSHQLIRSIGVDILRDAQPNTLKLIEKSLTQYSSISTAAAVHNTRTTDGQSQLLDFCLASDNMFAYQVLIDFPRRINVDYFDMRRTDFPSYLKVYLDLTLRQIGVVVKNKRKLCFGTYRHKIICKQSHEQGYEMIFVEPIYPVCPVPDLLELLNRNDFPEHDDVRIELLKWMVAETKLKPIDILSIPRKFLLDLVVLVHLTQNGFITVLEADIILFTIVKVEHNMIPNELEPPDQLNERAFIISFLYCKTQRIIASCFKVVGFTDYLVSNDPNIGSKSLL